MLFMVIEKYKDKEMVYKRNFIIIYAGAGRRSGDYYGNQKI